MEERRDIWRELKPIVENAINAAFEKHIPLIVEQCRKHDEIMILKHEVRSNSKKNMAIWGIIVTTFSVVLSTILDKFR